MSDVCSIRVVLFSGISACQCSCPLLSKRLAVSTPLGSNKPNRRNAFQVEHLQNFTLKMESGLVVSTTKPNSIFRVNFHSCVFCKDVRGVLSYMRPRVWRIVKPLSPSFSVD